MGGCNNLIYLAIVVFLAGIALLVIHRRRRKAINGEQAGEGGSTRSRVSFKILGIALIVLSIAMIAAGSYMVCSYKMGTCPPAIGGSGYVCTDEGAGCFGIIPGKCKTVAGSMPWDASCECKCK